MGQPSRGLLVIALAAACSTSRAPEPPAPAQPAPPPPPARPQPVKSPEPLALIGATELVGMYADNEIAADKEWKGERIRVAGIVRRVERIVGDAVASVGPELQPVTCTFDPAFEAEAEKLRRGGAVILEGTVTGGAPLGGVLLSGCRYPAVSDLVNLYPGLLTADKKGRVLPDGALAKEPGFRR